MTTTVDTPETTASAAAASSSEETQSGKLRDTSLDVLNVGLVVLALAGGVVTAYGVVAGSWLETTGRFVLASLLVLVALVVMASVTRVPQVGRRGWAIVGYSVSALAASEIAFVLFGPADFPTVADALAITFAFMGTGGLLLLPHAGGSLYGRLRLGLDAMAGMVAVSALVLEWIVSTSGSSWTDVAWERLARPAAALVLCGGLMVVAVRRSIYRFDRRLFSFSIGVGMLIAADLAVPVLEARLGGGEEYVVGLRFGATAAFAVMAWMMRRPIARREVALVRPGLIKLALPYGMVLVLFALFFWQAVSETLRIEGPMPWGALVVAGIIVVRQAVATRENREIIELERDQLIASVSHALRTPLTAVAGFADIVWDDWGKLTEPEAREMVDIIRFQSHYLAGIVNDMVALVRDDLDSVSLDVGRFEARELIADAIKAVFDLNGGPLPVTAQVEPYMEMVGDRERLTQVVISMLKNAQRYGKGKILVVARRTNEGRYLEVHDNGEGLPAKYEHVVWERFERGAHQLNAGVPCSGLGLAIVRAIARAHGGRADYRRSERLGGACFSIEIPYDADIA